MPISYNVPTPAPPIFGQPAQPTSSIVPQTQGVMGPGVDQNNQAAELMKLIALLQSQQGDKAGGGAKGKGGGLGGLLGNK